MEGLNSVYLSLGSNLGDRLNNLQLACHQLSEKVGEIIKISSVYQTPPFGFHAENDFLNTCLLIETEYDPLDLLQLLNSIETDLGRDRGDRGYTSRTIDLDIIFFNDLVFESEKLTIPHSRFRERKFVLLPLNDLEPDKLDPETHLTVKQLLECCNDISNIFAFQKQ